ncbi:hypothetical protein HCN44_001219 [Aphidius gifuensis]|uniref:Uncharacterized protein n=1 Tax=Aphidius gifuensis TaxID=684658 RepID=A0A834XL08_APHGI|nr:uncharacterized protein LOC122856943 [Aphidius gifuensis]KAF7988646.1 hypothetical protein HCN44_001219 [Aphidius gifuensis]
MVYISNDGSLLPAAPWINRFFGFFTSIFYGIGMFFNTLITPNTTKYGTGYTRNYRPGSGSKPATKKFGGLNLKGSMSMPGGCSSCAKNN